MKKILLSIVIALSLSLTACGADEKKIDNVMYQPYGIVNEDAIKDSNIIYEMSYWLIFWSIVFSETLVVPIYFIGWDLWQPISKKK
jgi:thioredoxin-related protein